MLIQYCEIDQKSFSIKFYNKIFLILLCLQKQYENLTKIKNPITWTMFIHFVSPVGHSSTIMEKYCNVYLKKKSNTCCPDFLAIVLVFLCCKTQILKLRLKTCFFKFLLSFFLRREREVKTEKGLRASNEMCGPNKTKKNRILAVLGGGNIFETKKTNEMYISGDQKGCFQ